MDPRPWNLSRLRRRPFAVPDPQSDPSQRRVRGRRISGRRALPPRGNWPRARRRSPPRSAVRTWRLLDGARPSASPGTIRARRGEEGINERRTPTAAINAANCLLRLGRFAEAESRYGALESLFEMAGDMPGAARVWMAENIAAWKGRHDPSIRYSLVGDDRALRAACPCGFGPHDPVHVQAVRGVRLRAPADDRRRDRRPLGRALELHPRRAASDPHTRPALQPVLRSGRRVRGQPGERDPGAGHAPRSAE